MVTVKHHGEPTALAAASANLAKVVCTDIVLCYSWQIMDMQFRQDYPTTSNAVLAARYGVSTVTILRWAQRFRLRKDVDYKREVQRVNAARRVVSAETKARQSAIMTGRTLSEEHKASLRRAKMLKPNPSGAAHYNWKGGRPWKRAAAGAYFKWRMAVLARDDFRCLECGITGGKRGRGLHAHHIKSYADFPDLRYETGNGLTLCKACHTTLHAVHLP